VKDRVFISYRRADTGPTAARLRDALEEHFPGQIFLDIENIAAGQDFVTVIENNLSIAAVLVVVIGRQWLEGSTSGTKLGDANDYVTLELLSAARLNIPLLPVVVDGAAMPHASFLPSGLASVLRSNAIEIRHSSFRRDCEPLTEYLYARLGVAPPTPLERFVEAIGAKLSFGMNRFKFDDRTRGFHAIISVIVALGATLATIDSWLPAASAERELLLLDTYDAVSLHILGVYTGFIGKNSRKHRKLAVTALAVTLTSLLALLTKLTMTPPGQLVF